MAAQRNLVQIVEKFSPKLVRMADADGRSKVNHPSQ
jgi:hypothetical protein